MNPSCDDYDDDLYFVFEDPDRLNEVPSYEWVRDVEHVGDIYKMADKGMGFLSASLKAGDPDTMVETGDGEESGETTIGKPGMGKVIDGIDAQMEQQLYKDLFKAYGTPRRSLISDGLGLSVAGFGLYLGDPFGLLLTLIVTVTYLVTRK